MKLKLQITDNANHILGLSLLDYWNDCYWDNFPCPLGVQKKNMRRVIKEYCLDKDKVIKVASVFPSILEVVSECIKARIIHPEDVELTVYGEHSIKDYSFTEDGDLDGDYKLINLINWLSY